MNKAKVSCSFCGKTNTKWSPKYVSSGFLGLGSTKVADVEEIDEYSKPFYRCAGCGRIFCQDHYESLCSKKNTGWFNTKTWYECPQCGSTTIKKL